MHAREASTYPCKVSFDIRVEVFGDTSWGESYSGTFAHRRFPGPETCKRLEGWTGPPGTDLRDKEKLFPTEFFELRDEQRVYSLERRLGREAMWEGHVKDRKYDLFWDPTYFGLLATLEFFSKVYLADKREPTVVDRREHFVGPSSVTCLRVLCYRGGPVILYLAEDYGYFPVLIRHVHDKPDELVDPPKEELNGRTFYVDLDLRVESLLPFGDIWFPETGVTRSYHRNTPQVRYLKVTEAPSVASDEDFALPAGYAAADLQPLRGAASSEVHPVSEERLNEISEKLTFDSESSGMSVRRPPWHYALAVAVGVLLGILLRRRFVRSCSRIAGVIGPALVLFFVSSSAHADPKVVSPEERELRCGVNCAYVLLRQFEKPASLESLIEETRANAGELGRVGTLLGLQKSLESRGLVTFSTQTSLETIVESGLPGIAILPPSEFDAIGHFVAIVPTSGGKLQIVDPPSDPRVVDPTEYEVVFLAVSNESITYESWSSLLLMLGSFSCGLVVCLLVGRRGSNGSGSVQGSVSTEESEGL